MSGRATGGFRLLQITDLHLFGDTGRTLYGVETARSLQRVLEQAFAPGTPRPDAIVVTGDVADDLSPAAYANFHAALEPWVFGISRAKRLRCSRIRPGERPAMV